MTPDTGNQQPAGAARLSDRYRVVVSWDPAPGWTGHVESDGRHLAEVTSPVLELLEARSRAALVGIVDRMAIALCDLDIELDVPPVIDEALQPGVAVHEVVRAMQGLNMSAGDVAAVLRPRLDSAAQGLLVVANADIAAHGLDRWPDAVAVQCVALGADTSTWCRACAQDDPAPFNELSWGNTVVISTGAVRCDRCGRTSGSPVGTRGDTPAPAPPDTPEGR